MHTYEPGQVVIVGGEQRASAIGAPRQEGGADPRRRSSGTTPPNT